MKSISKWRRSRLKDYKPPLGMDSPEQQTSKRNPFSLKHFVISTHSHSSSASSFMAINRPVGISWSNQPHNWWIVKMSSFSNKHHESKARRRKSWQASTWIYGQVSGAGRVGRGGGVEGGINHITPFTRFQLPSNTPVSSLLVVLNEWCDSCAEYVLRSVC